MKILIADAKRQDRDLAAKILGKNLMCDFIKVSTPKDAIRYLEEDPSIQLVLSELYLNNGKGDKIFKYIAEELDHPLPFIWLTEEKKESREIDTALNSGKMCWYIKKPHRPEALVFMAKNALGMAKQQSEQSFEEKSSASSEGQAAQSTLSSEAAERTKRLLEQLKKQKQAQESEPLKKKKEQAQKVEAVLAQLEKRKKEKLGHKEIADNQLVKKKIEDAEVELPGFTPPDVGDSPDAKKNKKKLYQSPLDWNAPAPSTSDIYLDTEDPNTAILDGANQMKMTENIERDDIKGLLENFMTNAPEKFTANISDEELAGLILRSEIFDTEKFVNENIERFYAFNTVNCNLYLRLSRSKLVRIINAHDIFTQEDIAKYSRKDVDYLYIDQNEYPRFRELYANYLRSRLRCRNISQRPKVIDTVLNDDLHMRLSKAGVHNDTIIIGEEMIHQALEIVRSSPKAIPELVECFEKHPFIRDHSIMTAFISVQIALNIQMDAPTTIQNLVLAALFHDTRIDEPHMASIYDLDSPEGKKISSLQKREYKKHCHKAADLIREGRDLHPEIDTIILQHHEKPDGSGFPWKLNAEKIIPLAALFIIAEDFCHHLLEFEDIEEINIEKILKDFGVKYFKGNFVLPLEGLLRGFHRNS